MRDVVLVPSYYRPEYLTLCLRFLAAADGASEKTVWVGQDRHTYDPAHLQNELPLVEAVADQFRKEGCFKELQYLPAIPNGFIGNPSNFLTLYSTAYRQLDVRFIYLVEDDVLVSKDFFRWHEAVQERANYFCTVGWHCVRNPEVLPSTDPTAYITSYRDFSSIGVCWKRKNLEPFVQHAVTEYYRDMAGYLAKAFPRSPIPAGQWTEQAGIVTRLLHDAPGERLVAWPALRRCSHVGVSGYHRPRGYQFRGGLADRVAALGRAVQDHRIQGMSHDFEDDIEAVTAPGYWEPAQLQVAQHIPYVPGKI